MSYEHIDHDGLESERSTYQPIPRAVPDAGLPPVDALPPLHGDCPVCWSECELSLAGRIRPHEPATCRGVGELPLPALRSGDFDA